MFMLVPLAVLAATLFGLTAQELPAIIEQTIAALVTIATIVASTIGITGGLKGIFFPPADSGRPTPELKIGPWKLKWGIVLSWAVAFGVLVVGYILGWGLPQPTAFESFEAWLAAEWVAFSLISNMFRNVAYG